MADVKGERLEIRLSADMMRQLRTIAPKDARGRPNVSELVRQALESEIQRHSLSRMALWAQENRDTLRQARREWDGTTGDGIGTR